MGRNGEGIWSRTLTFLLLIGVHIGNCQDYVSYIDFITTISSQVDYIFPYSLG